MLLSLGSVNADVLVRAGAAVSGPGTFAVHDLLRTSGGKAANVAVLAKRLGVEVWLLGCVGDDDLAEQALRGPVAARVELARVRRRPGPTGYAGIVVPPDGDKAIFFAANANDAWGDESAIVAADVAAAPDGSVLVVDLEIPVSLVDAALRAARARGFATVLDPAPPDRLGDDLLALVDHLTPDHAEAGRLTAVEIHDLDGAVAAAERLRDRGAAHVHVKLASGGCVVSSAGATALVAAPDDVDIVDKTGAGDAFTGALGWALHEGRTTLEAARVAVAASTVAVTGYGSQESYPSPTALAAMLDRVRVTAELGDAVG